MAFFQYKGKSVYYAEYGNGETLIFLHGNEWIVSLTIAAVIELFTSIRLPQEEEKEKQARKG